jgi:hypothetical protein
VKLLIAYLKVCGISTDGWYDGMRIGVCGGGGNSLEGETVWLALPYQFIMCTVFAATQISKPGGRYSIRYYRVYYYDILN